MKTAFKPDLKSKVFCFSKSYPILVEKEVSLVNYKFYQKLFVFFLAFSTILIFPESPEELEETNKEITEEFTDDTLDRYSY